MKRVFCILMACMVFTGLAGCSYEPREVTLHKPGVYKGDKDPLLARQQQELIDRFKLVQTDR